MAVMCIDLEIISTHTPLARRDFLGNIRHFLYKISTHTPLARRDDSLAPPVTPALDISTHTPLARRDNFLKVAKNFL